MLRERLLAIRADPDNDRLRREFADWIESQPFHQAKKHARVIRAQIELAQLPVWEPGRIELEAQLRRDMDFTASPGFRGAFDGLDLERGFPEQISLRWLEGIPHVIERVQRHPTVRSVEIGLAAPRGHDRMALADFLRTGQLRGMDGLCVMDNTLVGTYDIEALVQSPFADSLEKLHIHSIDRQSAALLANARRLTGVRQLTLYGTLGEDGAEALAASPYLRPESLVIGVDRAGGEIRDRGAQALLSSPIAQNLHTLSLEGHDISAAGLAPLLDRRAPRRIQRLKLAHNLLGREAAEILAQASCLASLRSLDAAFRDGAAAVRSLGRSPHLRQFDAWTGLSGLAPAALSGLGAKGAFPSLKYLELQDKTLDDAGAARLFAGNYPELVRLKLTGSITAAGIAELRPERFPKLRWLDLWSNPLGNAGATALARTGILAPLVRLDLRHCQIGIPGLISLTRKGVLRNLKSLDLRENAWEHGRGAAVLAKASSLAGLVDLRVECFQVAPLQGVFGDRVRS